MSLGLTFSELRESAARSSLGRQARLLRRRLSRADSQLLQRYWASADCQKLQIGGGWRVLEGWLNTDIELAPGVFHMDATKAFPLPDQAFRYVFCEHMIEHIDYAEAQAMLRECRRVLRPQGVIRIVTPNLGALAELLRPDRGPVQQQYYEFFLRHFLPEGHPPTDASVANAFVRSWGHRFIYDEPTLQLMLEGAGFSGVVRRRLGQSGHPELTGLEHETRYPPGLLDFESIALEATRCAA